MRTDWTPEKLIRFEDEIATLFEAKQIKAPVHLSGGNEGHLIRIFDQHVNPNDWVLCSWRSHYHCLLKGVPPEQVRQAILNGKSISLCFPEYKVLSSGIVGGTAPIAVGLAMGIKRKQTAGIHYAPYGKNALGQFDCGSSIGSWTGQPSNVTCMECMVKSPGLWPDVAPGRKVVCFLGDMTAETGIVYESIKYAVRHGLPVLWVVEDNGLSVVTETEKVWGLPHSRLEQSHTILRYHYKLTRPHVGIGKFVEF